MADSKISDLTALTTPALEDLLVVVDDPSGTPTTKKLALSDLVKDEDDMASDSATALATQQSIKAYSDSATQTMTNKTLTAPTLNMGDSMPSTNVRCRAYLDTETSYTSTAFVTIPFDAENYDIGNDFDTDNHKYVVPVDGYYDIVAQVYSTIGADGDYIILRIKKNSTTITERRIEVGGASSQSYNISDKQYFSATDEITITYSNQNNNESIAAGSEKTFISIHLLST